MGTPRGKPGPSPAWGGTIQNRKAPAEPLSSRPTAAIRLTRLRPRPF